MERSPLVQQGFNVDNYTRESRVSQFLRKSHIRQSVIDDTGKEIADIDEKSLQLERRVSVTTVHELEIHPDETLVVMNQMRPYIYMILFALLGMGMRTLITFYFNTWQITSLQNALFVNLPCNFFGCFLMGMYVPSKNVINLYSPALSLGLGTGMCGCITTWSAWNMQIALLFLQATDENNSYQIGSAFFAMGIGVCIAQGGLMLGKQCNAFLLTVVNQEKEIDPVEGRASFIFASVLLVICYILGIILIVIVFPFESGQSFGSINTGKPYFYYQYYVVALLVAPLGAILRWQLGAKYNGKIWFPIGTFIANVVGVFLDAVSYGIFDRVNPISLSDQKPIFIQTANQFQNMLVVAFCGNLSTVSTWINELNTFPENEKSWKYLIASFFTSQSFALILLGCITYINPPLSNQS